MALFRFLQIGGALGPYAEVAWCEECDGEGSLEVFELRGRIDRVDRVVACEACDGEGRLQEIECGDCGATLEVAHDAGVGAVIEGRTTKPDGRAHRYVYALCGPCALADMVEDGDEALWAR